MTVSVDDLARQMISDHEKLCGHRFGEIRRQLAFVIRVLSFAFVVIVGVTGWSLKSQWDTQTAAINAIHQTSDETVRKLMAVKPVDRVP